MRAIRAGLVGVLLTTGTVACTAPMGQGFPMRGGMGFTGKGAFGMASGNMGAGRMMHCGMMGSGMMGNGTMGGGMMGNMGCGGMSRGGMAPSSMGAGGMMGGEMMQGGMMGGMADMHLAHTLLANHAAIQRTVTRLPDGVETLTISRDPRIAALIPQHVQAMYERLKAGEVIRGFDPLFVALFQNAAKIQVRIEPRNDGVRVVETSADPYVVQLIQAHADAVDGFVKDGMAAMHQIHPVPQRVQPGQNGQPGGSR